MSGSDCCFLTCIQISQEAGQVVWYSHLFQNFPQFVVIHIGKGFSVVSETEVDIFLELLCFIYDPTDVCNLISGSSAFCKSSLTVWKFTVHILLEPDLEDFEHYFTSMWDECNCVVVWAFFGIAFLYKYTYPQNHNSDGDFHHPRKFPLSSSQSVSPVFRLTFITTDFSFVCPRTSCKWNHLLFSH